MFKPDENYALSRAYPDKEFDISYYKSLVINEAQSIKLRSSSLSLKEINNFFYFVQPKFL